MPISYFKSPIGWLEIEGDKEGIRRVEFVRAGRRPHPFPPLIKGRVGEGLNQLREYFQGRRKTFSLRLNPSGTTFQRRVWRALRKIPCGKTATYGEIARAIGSPKAARAVGAACGKNPIAIIIPCHRVVGGNGRLGGYSSGLGKKRWLIRHEDGRLRKVTEGCGRLRKVTCRRLLKVTEGYGRLRKVTEGCGNLKQH